MYYFLILFLCLQLVVDCSIAESEEQNPENGDLFEGDIRQPAIKQRAGIPNLEKRWHLRTLVYNIGPGFTPQQVRFISEAIKEIETKTCIKFVRGFIGDHVVYTHSDKGCSSDVGRTGGRQEILLADGCFGFGKGSVLHETYHALGFYHEQSRPDRDKYIQIIQKNLLPNKFKRNFNREDNAQTYKLPYDYAIIKHYDKNAFGKTVKGKQLLTIKQLRPGPKIGQRKGLSVNDIHKMNRMYACEPY